MFEHYLNDVGLKFPCITMKVNLTTIPVLQHGMFDFNKYHTPLDSLQFKLNTPCGQKIFECLRVGRDSSSLTLVAPRGLCSFVFG